ncbi:unnamed protein product [Larinioides sclopetarius]|uniref:Uncharacterized protein n=1 Tax=Larinioides sclopetarius TaxID=280406 RepID=A0AAV1ZYS0_9ARAC
MPLFADLCRRFFVALEIMHKSKCHKNEVGNILQPILRSENFVAIL